MPNQAVTPPPLSLTRLQGFITRTYKSKFVRNVAVVASGTAGAQAITIAFTPIITRLYGAEAFGLLGTFISMVTVITPIVALCYPFAIVLPKDESDAMGIAKLSAYIALGVSALTALVLMTAGDRIVELLQVQEISSYIWLLPIVLLFISWHQINTQWVIRKKHFGVKARAEMLHAFIINVVNASIGLFKPLASVLILIYALGKALHAFMLSYGVKKADGYNPKINTSYSSSSLWKLAKNYCDFSLYRMPGMLMRNISGRLPIIMLASFISPAAAGYYFLCNKTLNMPSRLIGESVSSVFYPRINEAIQNKEDIFRLLLKATISLLALGIMPFALVFTFGPWLFGFVFGEEWIIAGEYAKWLSLMMFFDFIIRPSKRATYALRLQKLFLSYEIIDAITRTTCMIVALIFFNDDILAVFLYSITGALMCSILVFFVFLNALHFVRINADR